MANYFEVENLQNEQINELYDDILETGKFQITACTTRNYWYVRCEDNQNTAQVRWSSYFDYWTCSASARCYSFTYSTYYEGGDRKNLALQAKCGSGLAKICWQ